MRITDDYVFFWHGIYSNWHPAEFDYEGQHFLTSEQAFMWEKARFFNDEETANKILLTKTPKEAKDLGRQIKNYKEEDWVRVREAFMYEVVKAKFQQNSSFLSELLATDEKILVEASPIDKIWGIGMAENDTGIEDETNWKGKNLLGIVLMDVRSFLYES